jgi:hypothetical protein
MGDFPQGVNCAFVHTCFRRVASGFDKDHCALQGDLDAAVRVVTFCDLPPGLQARSPVEKWEVPPVSTEYSASREAMLLRIERLLLELTRSQEGGPHEVDHP